MTTERCRDIEARLIRFIVEELLEERYQGGDPLAGGAVDSLGIEQLVDYLEGEYGVRIEEEDMVEESFESIHALAAMVEAKLGGVPS